MSSMPDKIFVPVSRVYNQDKLHLCVYVGIRVCVVGGGGGGGVGGGGRRS